MSGGRGTVRGPLIGRLALRLLLTPEECAAVLSELDELRETRARELGEAAARHWYARQLRAYPLRLLSERLRRLTKRSAVPEDGADARDGRAGGVLPLHDVRQALRGLARAPALTATVIVTVGLGLGASIAMFAVVRAVLLNAIPYPSAERLVRIYHAVGSNRWNLSVADILAIEEQQTTFEEVAAYTSTERTLTYGDVAERVRVRGVTANWFDLTGIRPLAGRGFRRSDGEPGSAPVALVSWGFWQGVLGGDPAAVGRTIRLDGELFEVIGVLPREVGPFEERFDVFPALQFAPPTRKGPFLLTVVGRLRPAVDTALASGELRAINRRIFPIWQAGWSDSTATWGVMPLDEFAVGRLRPPLLVLLGAVLLVLLISSVNSAGLLTARVLHRRSELATRAALGASRARLAGLLALDGALLATAGAALGIAIALAVVRAIRAAGPDFLPRAATIGLDGAVLGVAAALAVASFLVLCIVPMLQLVTGGGSTFAAMRAAGRTVTASASAHRVRRALVAAQFAIAVPLLAGAALLANSFLRLQRVDAGFDPEGVLSVAISTPGNGYGAEESAQFWDRLLERVRALPGVVAAGLNNGRPPREAGDINNFDPLDRPTPPGRSEPTAVWQVASPGYFDAIGVRLVSGRMFDERDNPDLGTTSALVDRTWVANVYPDEDPIGKRLYEGGCRAEDCSIINIVGVVEDVRYLGLDDSNAGASVGTLYVPQAQWFASSSYLFVRSTGDPLMLLPSIRAIVRELDPAVPLTDVATGDELIDSALVAPRNLAGLVTAFAVVALALAMIGIYGVMSYFVQEHRREIGIRLALGSRRADVIGLVLGRGMRPALFGTALGFALAVTAAGAAERLLYGVRPHDPVTFTIVAATLLCAAILACGLPARRAAGVHPTEALATE